MKKKKVVSLVIVLGVLIFITLNVITEGVIVANKDDFEPYVNFYDQNGDIIDSTIEENIDYKKPYVMFYDQSGYLINSYTQEQIEERFIKTDIYKKSDEMNGEEPYANFYDENGMVINQLEDIDKGIFEFADQEDNIFLFRSSSFLKNVVIGQGEKFHKPKNIIIEPDVKFQSMTISLINSVDEKVGEIKLGNFVETLNIDLDDYIEDDFYSIKFINGDQDKSIQLVGGVVIYN